MMWFLLNLLTAYLLQYILLVVHELGHASVAALLRFRIFSIRIGFGKQLFETRRLGFLLTLNTFPSIGLTLATPRSKSWWRLQRWAFIFAGPATQLIFLTICYIASARSFYLGYSLPKIFTQFAPLESFLVANLFLFLLSIYPRRIKHALGTAYTDGYQLLRIPFSKKNDFDAVKLVLPRLEALEFMRNGEYSEAMKIYNAEFAKTPDDNSLRHDMAIANLQNGEYEKSRELFMELLDSEELNKPVLHNILLNNIAWVSAVVGKKEWIEQADEFSNEAYNSAPNFALFIGTRGTVLVRLGKYKDGIILLKKAFKYQSNPDSRAAEACFIAIGEANEGNMKSAQKWIDRARRESPSYHLNNISEKEINAIIEGRGTVA